MAKKLALLHTSAVHIKTFDDLLAKTGVDILVLHVLNEDLLAHSQRLGFVDSELQTKIELEIAKLADCTVILCTCSSIAQAAVDLSAKYKLPILRIDKPMAEKAISLGDKITVLAVLESTIKSSHELLEAVIKENHSEALVLTKICKDAWQYFELGKYKDYYKKIAQCIDNLADSTEVIVLAQASMADAKRYCKTKKPVLSSPELALEAVLAYF